MKITFLWHEKDDRFAFIKEEESGVYGVAIPVFNGLVEYYEYYKISDKEYHEFSKDLAKARVFVEGCENHKEDSRLLQQPGRLRGWPIK